MATIPSFACTRNTISSEELIGKGNPILFGKDYKLREEAHLAFQKMKSEALRQGVHIQIVSSYRNFEHQKSIWERKYKRYRSQGFSEEKSIQKITQYSTIPGTSRHHWGTDMDIIDANVPAPKNVLREDNFHGDGAYTSLKKWMDANANSFGFHLVYTRDLDRKGFKYEPWHYSYKPLSQNYLKSYKSISIKEVLQKEKLLGSTHFSEAFLSSYRNENILDINPELL